MNNIFIINKKSSQKLIKYEFIATNIFDI
jgi:hypothetical protein